MKKQHKRCPFWSLSDAALPMIWPDIYLAMTWCKTYYSSVILFTQEKKQPLIISRLISQLLQTDLTKGEKNTTSFCFAKKIIQVFANKAESWWKLVTVKEYIITEIWTRIFFNPHLHTILLDLINNKSIKICPPSFFNPIIEKTLNKIIEKARKRRRPVR